MVEKSEITLGGRGGRAGAVEEEVEEEKEEELTDEGTRIGKEEVIIGPDLRRDRK